MMNVIKGRRFVPCAARQERRGVPDEYADSEKWAVKSHGSVRRKKSYEEL